jgi:hypothetical protein
MSEFVINKSVLIIKSQEKSLLSVENFLRNREWNIFSTTSLKDALVYLVSKQPMFVFVSIDHPNKKVQNLPRVLAQAFPVCAVMFAENATPGAYSILNASNLEYKLFPPVTGPAVERLVNKYGKDQTQKATQANAISQWTNGESGNDSISIKGGEQGGSINVKGGEQAAGYNSSSAQALLAAMLSGDPNALAEAQRAAELSNAMANQGNTSNGGHGFIAGNNSETSDAALAAALGQVTNKDQGNGAGFGSGLSALEKGAGMGSKLGSAGEGIGAGTAIDPTSQDPSKAASLKSNQSTSSNEDDTAPSQPSYSMEEFDKSALDDLSTPRPSNEAGGWAPMETPNKVKRSPTEELADTLKGKLEVENLIAKGAQKSLDESVIRFSSPHQKQVNLQDSSNVSCLIIVSPRFSGYLVTAMGKNKKIDEKFIEKIRQRLFNFLKQSGENVKEDERSMDMKIKEVNFQEWAAESAEFLKKSVHNGNEVAMAFFPKPDVKTEFKESAAAEMLAVDLKEIKTDVPLEFNVYLYLPRNGKYVLYTPEGGIMYKGQKEKLEREGVKELHILKEDAERVDSHRAKSYLESTIDEMNLKKSFAKAS